jgi:hypothetical protein
VNRSVDYTGWLEASVPDAERNSSDLTSIVHKLQRIINTLTEQQTEALQSSTYVRMNPEEAKDYDDRRNMIVELTEKLNRLRRPLSAEL